MKFGKIQVRKFGTDAGAYSEVTKTEYGDSQITLTDYEADLVVSHFGNRNIYVGNVRSSGGASKKTFRRYPDGKNIELNLVYPKPAKTELRLYLSQGAGFMPSGGHIWFIFKKGRELWIGAMEKNKWRDESSELKRDEGDFIYQEIVNDVNEVRISELKSREVYRRDREIAIRRMEMAGFTCEYDSEHKLFVSRFSQKKYLEAHHLIPIGLQKEFKKPLDNIHNVFCLCPYCHRAVHHADEKTTREILGKLARNRPTTLELYQLNVSELFNIYAVEEID